MNRKIDKEINVMDVNSAKGLRGINLTHSSTTAQKEKSMIPVFLNNIDITLVFMKMVMYAHK